MTRRLRLARALAALIVGAAGGTVVTAGSAYAAACPAGTGVTVVVNSSVGCDANGGGSAASNFRDAGHTLTRASRQPGFVCRVDGYDPADPCVNASPANAYWALFWSDGKSGKWTFASSGVDGLSVPAGGWVALKFQRSTTTSYPGVTPYTAPPAPKPKPTTRATTPASGPHASGTPTAVPTAKRSDATKTPDAKASSTATPDAVPTQPGDDAKTSPAQTGGSSSLGWIAGGLVLVLLAGMGAVLWRRRTAGGRTP